LKPGAFKLWVTTAFNVHAAPPRLGGEREALVEGVVDDGRRRDVALQVAFERQTLKPAFHLIGYRLWV
jgi:hypothetical protein